MLDVDAIDAAFQNALDQATSNDEVRRLLRVKATVHDAIAALPSGAEPVAFVDANGLTLFTEAGAAWFKHSIAEAGKQTAMPGRAAIALYASPQSSSQVTPDHIDVLRELAREEVARGYVEHAKWLRYAANRLASFDALDAIAALSPVKGDGQ